MQKLQQLPTTAAVALLSAASATVAVAPPASAVGLVPSAWAAQGGAPGELELSVWADASRALTGVQLYAALLHPNTFADITVTANAGTDQLNATGHARESGDGPALLTTTATFPGNTDGVTQYYLSKVDANNVKLALTREDALKGTNLIDLSSAGTGTIKITAIANTTMRAHWHAMGLLGPASDGAVTLDAVSAYNKVIACSVAAIAFALIATFGAGTGAVSAAILPRFDRG